MIWLRLWVVHLRLNPNEEADMTPEPVVTISSMDCHRSRSQMVIAAPPSLLVSYLALLPLTITTTTTIVR